MIILLDCDDVLSQFTQGVIDVLNRDYKYDFNIDDVTDWNMSESLGVPDATIYGIAGREGFCESLNVMPGAKKAVKKLMQYGEVFAVTSPIWSSKTWMYERNKWLYEHFSIDSGRVVQTSAKHVIRGDVFIDDRSTNVKRWLSYNPERCGIVLDVPWPRQQTCDDELLCPDWDEAVRTVYEYCERMPV